MASTYTTHNVLLESANFNVLIIEFPEEEINERLALLMHEKGFIYKHLYEDFVLTSCLANSGPFFFHVRKRPGLLTKFADIRKEVLSLVFKYSPGFCPENIVIDANNTLRTVGSLSSGEKAMRLVDNDFWGQDPPLSNFGPGVIVRKPADDSDDEDFFISDDDEDTNFFGPEPPSNNPFTDNTGGIMSNDVPYELVGHKWDTPNVHINVRQYEEGEEALTNLLGGTPFESVRGYHLLIVELCIEDFSNVFHLLDKTGVTKKCKPEDLIAELYEIVIVYNPFLKLEVVDLKKIRKEYMRKHKLRHKTGPSRRATAAGINDKVESKQDIKFSDVSNQKLLALTTDMKKKIVGQDAAIEHIAGAVHRASVGLKRDHEPIGVLLFAGQTGVGKTETVKALSEILGSHLVRVDCQEYQHAHEVAKLTGSPPGYVGYDDGGHLTKEVSEYPFSVVLFDEIEKAHSNFHERILQIIDDGVLTDSKGGRKVPFNETIIIMTSNVGVKEVDSIGKTVGFGGVSDSTEVKTTQARTSALKNKFKPEFLNRIDELIHFRTLGTDDFMQVLDILLDESRAQVEKKRGISLQVNTGAKNFILNKGTDKKFGARPLRRAVKKYLSTPLARAILESKVTSGSKVTASLNRSKDGLVFRQPSKKVE